MAAAVHEGWISVQEGVLDTLDLNTYLDSPADDGRPNNPSCVVDDDERTWARWVIEQYMNPGMKGARG